MSKIIKHFLSVTAVLSIYCCNPLIRAQEEEVEPRQEEKAEETPVIVPEPPIERPTITPEETPVAAPEAAKAEASDAPGVVVPEPPVLITLAPEVSGGGEIKDIITSLLAGTFSPPEQAQAQANNVPPETLRDYGSIIAKESGTIPIEGLGLFNDTQLAAFYEGIASGLEELQSGTVSFATRVLDALNTVALAIGSPISAIILLFTNVINPLFTSEAMRLAKENQNKEFDNASSASIERLNKLIDTASESFRTELINLRDQIEQLSAASQAARIPETVTGL